MVLVFVTLCVPVALNSSKLRYSACSTESGCEVFAFVTGPSVTTEVFKLGKTLGLESL